MARKSGRPKKRAPGRDAQVWLSRAASSRRRAVCRSRVASRHPQCCARMTGCQRAYGWLRRPSTTTRVLALTLVHGCPSPTDRHLDLPGDRVFSMSDATRPRTPGSTSAARHRAAPIVAYRRDKTVGTHQPKRSGLNTFKVGFTRYLWTSPAYLAYTSTRLLPAAPQGAILGSWRTMIQAGQTALIAVAVPQALDQCSGAPGRYSSSWCAPYTHRLCGTAGIPRGSPRPRPPRQRRRRSRPCCGWPSCRRRPPTSRSRRCRLPRMGQPRTRLFPIADRTSRQTAQGLALAGCPALQQVF